MPRPEFRSDIAESINKLVPKQPRGNGGLKPREPREAIAARKGRGTLSEAATSATPVEGVATSADGMFVIPWESHTHA